MRRRCGAVELLLPLVLSGLVLMCLPGNAPAQGQEYIVVRNDAEPVLPDFDVGRFGTGRLYFDDPLDIAVSEDGDVFILDAGNYRVQTMDDRGRFKEMWGSRGTGDGQFENPVAMAISPDNDFLVVLENEDDRVQMFDPDGNFILSLEVSRIGKGSLKDPVDLTVDTLGYIYILDRERKKVLKFHKGGSFVSEWGSTGRRDKDLVDPVSLAYSDFLTGFILVLDVGKGALVQYHRDGDFRSVIDLPPEMLASASSLLKVESDKDGNLFVLDAGLGKLIRLEKRQISIFSLRSEEVKLLDARGIGIDPDGRIYITDISRNRVYRFPLELN